MKKLKLLISSIVVLSMCFGSNTAFAKTGKLDIENVIKSSVENAYDIKSYNYSVEKAENACDKAEDAAYEAKKILIMNEDIIRLKGKKDKTPEEKALVENYKLLTEEQKYQLIKTDEVGPEMAKSQLDIARNNKEVFEDTLKFKIYSEYITLLNNKDRLSLQEEKSNSSLDKYNSIQLQIKLGLLPAIEGKKIQSSHMNDANMLAKEQRQFEVYQMDMNSVIGAPVEDRYDSFSKDVTEYDVTIKTLEEYISNALKNRADIFTEQKNLDIKKLTYDIAKREFTNENERHNKNAKFELEEAENKLEMCKLDIQQEITNSYNELTKKVKNLESAKKSFEVNNKEFNKILQKYNLGMISKIDMITEEIKNNETKNKLKASERDLWLTKLKMDFQCKKGLNNLTIK